MADVKTYSPDRHKLTVGGKTISGVADGTFFEVSEVSDGVTSVSGAYGDVARCMSLDGRINIKATLLQTSADNTYLSGLADADKISGGDGAIPILLKDLRGALTAGGTGWVVKKADASSGDALNNREWNFVLVGEYISGGMA